MKVSGLRVSVWFFFVKQKKAYEMRISDWSSGVCSSDLFYVYETRQTVKARNRPIIIITSNNEKELPDAFLRRCFFHYIRFPEKETMQKIVDVHFPDLKKNLTKEAMEVFFGLRDLPGLKKKPSTYELLDWLKNLLA